MEVTSRNPATTEWNLLGNVGMGGHWAAELKFAGYDNVVARRPALGRLLRGITYALEGTPLEALGLSHFLIYEKASSCA